MLNKQRFRFLYILLLLIIGAVFCVSFVDVSYAGVGDITVTFNDSNYGHFIDVEGNVIETVQIPMNSQYSFRIVYNDGVVGPDELTTYNVSDYLNIEMGTYDSISSIEDGLITVTFIDLDSTVSILSDMLETLQCHISLPVSVEGQYDIGYSGANDVDFGSTINFSVSFNEAYTQSIDTVTISVIDAVTDQVVYESLDGTRRIDDNSIDYSLEIYADYILTIYGINRNTYTVSFYKTIEDEPVSTQTIIHGDDAVAPNDMVGREGYAFYAWDKTYENVNQDMNIYAIYQPIFYKVTYMDGTELLGIEDDIIYGGSANPPEVSREGYYFNKWVYSDGRDAVLNSVTSDVTVYANYIKKTYTVVFMLGTSVIDTQDVPYMEDATPPEITLEQGYEFLGWQGGYRAVTDNAIVSAIYSLRTFNVRFIDIRTGEVLASKLVAYNSTCPVPLNNEYGRRVTVNGYYTSLYDGIKYNFEDTILSDTDIYVDIIFEYRTVSFYIDGRLYARYRVKFGQSFTDIPQLPYREGYDVVPPVWSENEFNAVTVDTRVDAIYTINEYTVTLVMPDGSEQVYTVNHGDSIDSIPQYSTHGLDRLNINLLSLNNITSDRTINITVGKKYEIILSIVGVLAVVLMFVLSWLISSMVKDMQLRLKAKADRQRKYKESLKENKEETHIKKLRF